MKKTIEKIKKILSWALKKTSNVLMVFYLDCVGVCVCVGDTRANEQRTFEETNEERLKIIMNKIKKISYWALKKTSHVSVVFHLDCVGVCVYVDGTKKMASIIKSCK